LWRRTSAFEGQVSDDGISILKRGQPFKFILWDDITKIKTYPLIIFTNDGAKFRVPLPLMSQREMIRVIKEIQNEKQFTLQLKRPNRILFVMIMILIFACSIVFFISMFIKAIKIFGYMLAKDRVVIAINYVDEYNRLTKPDNYDPNDNAASYYEKAFQVMVSIPNDIKDLRKFWPGDMNSGDFGRVKNWVESNSQAIDYLKQAAQRPYCWMPLHAKNNFMMEIAVPELSKLRTSAYCLSSHAKLMAKEGQIEQAFQELVDTYKIGTHFSGPKTLVHQLVGIAISAAAVESGFQILNNTQPASNSLKNFQQQLQSLSSPNRFIIDFAAEKLMNYDAFQRLFTDDGRGNGHMYGSRFFENPVYSLRLLLTPQTDSSEWHKWAKMDRRKTTELADKMYEYFSWAAHRPPWYFHNEGIDPNQTVSEMLKDNYLLNILAPAFTKVLRISYRIQVHTDGLITTIAILRYKADNDGYPKDLQHLVATGYLNELPIDVFSGKPLVYKLTDDNFTLYSFATDFDDDGGKHDSKWAEGGDGDYVFWPVQQTSRIEKEESRQK